MGVFDILNIPESILPIEEYFESMDLTELEKKKRRDFAYEVEDIMLYIFSLFSVMKKYNRINKEFIISQLKERYSEVILQYMDIDKYLDGYITDFSEETVDVTFKHIDEPFYLSEDRGILIAENEANGVFNYQEYADAISSGKKRKRWITERDDKVRETHAEVNGLTIPIKEPFVVGNSLMMFPKDRSLNAEMEQIANCRCTIQYI